jgi:hypothetical protein
LGFTRMSPVWNWPQFTMRKEMLHRGLVQVLVNRTWKVGRPTPETSNCSMMMSDVRQSPSNKARGVTCAAGSDFKAPLADCAPVMSTATLPFAPRIASPCNCGMALDASQSERTNSNMHAAARAEVLKDAMVHAGRTSLDEFLLDYLQLQNLYSEKAC